MKSIIPSWYEKFKCIADKCPNHCCKDWKIEIDEASLEKYSWLKGENGRSIKNSIDWYEGSFFHENGSCKMLRKDGLCFIQKNFGESYLCETCAVYPRHTEEFPGCREYSLCLSCPEAVRLIFASGYQTVYRLQEDEEAEKIKFEPDEYQMYGYFSKLRNRYFRIVYDPEKTLDDKCRELLMACEGEDHCPDAYPWKLSDGLSEKELTLLESLTEIGDGWHQILQDYRSCVGNLSEIERKDAEEKYKTCLCTWKYGDISWEEGFSAVLGYYIYLFLCSAVYYGEPKEKLVLCFFLVRCFRELLKSRWLKNGFTFSMEDIMDLMSRFSRQTEHEDENLNLVETGSLFF